MGKFDGYLILTDLDGTLLNSKKEISEENKSAIRWFQEQGGRLSFVTGRVVYGAKNILKMLTPNAPCGHGNGSVIYDHTREEVLWSCSLPPSVATLVDCVVEHEPSVGVVLGTQKTSYFHRDNGSTAKYRKHEGFEHIVRDIHTLDEPLGKVLFASEDESTLLRVADRLASHPLANEFSFIRTDAEYYEIVPKGTSKGTLTLKLSELTGIPLDHIIAVGDNDNDAPMLKTAGIGIAVANASPRAKAAADRITVSNEDHALARIISEL